MQIILVVLIFFGMISSAVAQSYRDERNFTAPGEWRQFAPDHYNSGQCCYCLAADDTRAGNEPGITEFLVLGRWWPMRNSDQKDPLPNKPVHWVTICDPLKRDYPCIIYGTGV